MTCGQGRQRDCGPARSAHGSSGSIQRLDARDAALLRDRRRVFGSAFAIAGIVVITGLMETKPF